MTRTGHQTVRAVTLIVYGWRDNAPGTLAWVFPSAKSARAAVRALRNAVGWLIVAGRRVVSTEADVARLLASGDVLAVSC